MSLTSWLAPGVVPPASAAGTDVAVRTIAQGIARPYGITGGPDGNVWFANISGESIARITPSGAVTHFTGAGIRAPRAITAGPDGNLWFTNDGRWTFPMGQQPGGIGRMTPEGAVTVFTDLAISYPTHIVAGPDGNLWFTNTDEYKPSIGRITPAGAITIFTDPGIRIPLGITSGPDGNLWFTNRASDPPIGRITPDGTVTTFRGPGPISAGSITAGPDGNLWFLDSFSQSIGRITPDGVISHHTGPDVRGSGHITRGPDGHLWFTNPGSGRSTIGKVSTAGAITLFTSPGVPSADVIAAGPDGNLWYTMPEGDRIGRITPDGERTVFEGNRIRGPGSLAAGDDGNVWFINGHGQIGRITPDGHVSNFTRPDLWFPGDITKGPDGNMWFNADMTCPEEDDRICGAIGRVTPSGEITLFRSGIGTTASITAGPDGNLWFTDGHDSVRRITPAGVVTTFAAPGFKRTKGITAGADGNLWFVDFSWDAKVGRMTPTGELTTFTDPGFEDLEGITAGPDGALWVASLEGSINRITTSGAVSSFPAGTENPSAISAGPDGNLWYTDPWSNAIGRMTPTGVTSVVTAPSINFPYRIAPGPDGNMWFTGGNSLIGSLVTSLPGPPRDVVATPASGAATVAWGTPASEGSTAVTGYTVTASPGGQTCTWSSGPLVCTVHGLASGISHTFTVVATNGAGPGPASSPSNPVVPTDEVAFHPVNPVRILDSRPAGPKVGPYATPWGAGQTRDVVVNGAGGVPPGARAVVANLTVTGTTAPGFLSIWPAGRPRPLASSANWAAGQTVANAVTVPVGTGGAISVFNAAGRADVIIDVVGYYDATPGAGLTPLTPARISDSRTVGAPAGSPWSAGHTRDVTVAGVGGVAAAADAVVVNVTVTGSTAAGYLTIWPAGQLQPVASSLNWSAGQTVANAVTVKVGAGGKISIGNATGSTHVVIDAVGSFASGTGHLFHPLDPARIQDSRPSGPQVGPHATRWGPGSVRPVQVSGAGGVPAGAAAALLNVTATATTAASYLTVVPAGASAVASSLNWQAGQTVANSVTAKLGSGGAISIGNAAGSTHVIADVSGWYG